MLFLRANRAGRNDEKALTHALALQRTTCQQALDRLRASVVKEYTEYGGAVDIGGRSELLDMLGDLMIQRNADYVIAADWSRLGRKFEDLAFINNVIEEAGALLVIATDHLDARLRAELFPRLPEGHQQLRDARPTWRKPIQRRANNGAA